MSCIDLKIDWSTHEAVVYACRNWHYSKSIPVGKLVKVGAWEDRKFVGVVVFSYGANNNLCKSYGLTQHECCELTRIAFREHQTPVSRIMMLAIKMLKQQSPGLRLIISYADTEQGHHGGIYQATNWIYHGLSVGNRSVMVRGKKIHMRQASSIYRNGLPDGAVIVKSGDKHKYLMPLDQDIRKKISPLSQPYPKRVKEQESGFPSDLGGASPTHTLQPIK